jgi:hypothetical protein
MFQLNEQVGQEIKQFMATELKKLVQQEVTAAIKKAIAKDGAEVVKTEIANGTRDLSKAAGIAFDNAYKAARNTLGRELTENEKSAIKLEVKKLTQEESKKLVAADAKSLASRVASNLKTGVKNITTKVKKLFGGGTKELKPTIAKTAQVEKDLAKITAKEQQELVEGVTKKGWNWARVKKWGFRLGIGGLALWWFFHDSDADAPSDIPTDNSNAGGGGGTQGGGKYTSCPETLPIKQFCKNETVRRVQACLALPAKYQTGNFGPITQKALEGKGQDGTTITTETIIAVCGNSGLPGTEGTGVTGATANTPETKNLTGYEDYTTDEVETSVEQTASAPTSAPTSAPASAPASTNNVASVQQGKKSFIGPLDNDQVEQ